MPEISESPALVIENLHKAYGNGVVAVKNLSLTVEKGDFFALLGANGAGKSTTIGMITSLVRKTSGKIHIFGIDTDKNFQAAKRLIGLVPQEFNFDIFMTCIDVVRSQVGYYNFSPKESRARAEKALDQLGLSEKKNEQVRALSGGMKRRLMIARAIAHEPALLILDEPTAGVDLQIRRDIWAFLKEINTRGTTVILTTHYLEEAEQLCRNIGIIRAGELRYCDSIKQLLAKSDEETFILDIATKTLPSELLQQINGLQVDENTLEIRVSKSKGLNSVFAALSLAGVVVLSLRNKVNRLEELFLKIAQK